MLARLIAPRVGRARATVEPANPNTINPTPTGISNLADGTRHASGIFRYSPKMPSFRHGVTYWLALAAASLLAIGFFAYSQIDQTVGDPSIAMPTKELVGRLGDALLLATAVALVAILFAGIQVGAELKRRRRAETALQDTLASVEQQVLDRTEALSRAMSDIKVSEQQFRLIAELSPVHLFRATPDGEAIFLTPGFLAITGLTAERARGFGWMEAVHPDERDQLMASWHEALHSQVTFQAEFRFRTAAGEFRWYRARVVPDRDESGAIIGWVGAAVDLHELHLALGERAAALERAEEARRAAEEASHLKDEFLATASHELRTPLNAIVGWVHVLQSGALPDEDQRKHAVDAIDRNAKIQTRLIEDLLDVSRMIQGRLSLTVAPLDLRSVVDGAVDTVKPAAAAKQIRLKVDMDHQPLMVIGDDHRLQQIAWNLLANAVKYTPKGGSIDVTVDYRGSRATLRVKDSGEGIDSAFLPYVFEPFRQGALTTMRSGLGLGLAIVRRLVDLHGGRITASSDGVGAGAEFVVSLPLAQGSALPAHDGRGTDRCAAV